MVYAPGRIVVPDISRLVCVYMCEARALYCCTLFNATDCFIGPLLPSCPWGSKVSFGVRVLLWDGFERGRMPRSSVASGVVDLTLLHFGKHGLPQLGLRIGILWVHLCFKPIFGSICLLSTIMKMTGRLETTTFFKSPIHFHDG